jgi:hypothetical protein
MATIPSTAFKKGEKRPNQGKRGPGKVTKELKEMILSALDESGGVEYLVERARDPRTASAFLTLVGKVLPMQVTGEGGGPVQTVARIELVALGSEK